MFCKTINEWRKNSKDIAINEGGGAGISFKTKTNIWFVGSISKDTFEVTTKEVNPDDSFDASGYDDGMTGVKTDELITWSAPELTREMIMSIALDDGTMQEELEKYDSIEFKIEARYIYNNMHFGGWIRGKLKEGDLIFSQDFNRNKEFDVEDNNIDLVGNDAEGQNTIDEYYDNDKFFMQLSPTGIANEEFTYFWNDVFEYDLTKDSENAAYDRAINDDIYDDTISEYMADNGITTSLEEYKNSLVTTEEVLPDELYSVIQKKHNVESFTNDNHWDDVQMNYGV